MIQPAVTLRYKFLLFLGFALFYAIFYIVPNFWPIYPPRMLTLLPIDRAMPFLPWTFVIYLSDYVLSLIVILALTERDKFHSFARMAFTVLVLSGLFFIFFPTTYPRPAYPKDEFFLIQFLMELVGGADTPNNCFPSMHVAITGACAFSMSAKGFRWAAACWFWGILIFISTLTTKQHYFVDILGGFLISVTAFAIDRFIVRSPSLLSWGDRAFAPLINKLNS